MNTEKHLAPWTYDGHGVNDANGKRIASIRRHMEASTTEAERIGTAMAAAPALAGALRGLLNAAWQDTETLDAAIQQARAALALIDDTSNT